MQQLWSSLLKIPQASLSCEANFFALGGDSILSIQLVSRAAEQGLYFSVKDLFRHQHIVALARCVKQSKGYTIAQEAVIGEMPLLPIQQAFFKNETALAHFNQSVLLSTPEDFDTQCLIPMLQALVTRHDALRLSFDKSQGQWRGWYQALEALALSNCIEQHEWDGEAESLTAIAERAQRSLSPIDGELLRLVYLANKAGTGRLLLVIHHLVVD
ncbi:non-ribosomal peptide synthetase, partial [Pseudoalteromonas sp. JC28]|uniref:condensation domain-containing protein n=1 Tax=Pseudoalteromonas sp. JC28 TaxID=2267617 RepID=UPI0020C70EE2